MDVFVDERLRGLWGDRTGSHRLGTLIELEQLAIGLFERGHVSTPHPEAADDDPRLFRDPGRQAILLPIVLERSAGGGEDLDGVTALRETRGHLEDLLLCSSHQRPAKPGNDERGSDQGRRPIAA
jgi:hypothetical protein